MGNAGGPVVAVLGVGELRGRAELHAVVDERVNRQARLIPACIAS